MQTQSAYAEEYERELVLIDDRLRTTCASIGQGPLRDAMIHAIQGGKRIRPRVTMLACEAAGGHGADALDPAAAIELLHAASLVHDDIMDRSDLRRGRPTLYLLHGIPSAILAGDMMVAVAFRLLVGSAVPNKEKILAAFAASYVDLCEGQSEDIGFSGSPPLDVSSHRLMVRKKTAELLGAATAIGAIVATDDDSVITSLRRFGIQLGMAYQAADDLLERTGSVEELGKRPGVDAKNGRTTFLSMAYPETESLAAVSKVIGEHTAAAIRELHTLKPSPARDALERMASMLAGRNR